MPNVPHRRAALVVASTALALALSGCPTPVDAPTDLDELGAFLFTGFDSDDRGLREAGLANLATFFDDTDLDGGYLDRSYGLEPLPATAVDAVVHPERDLDTLIGIALVAASAYPPAQQSELFLLADQTPIDPSSPDLHARSFVDPTDPSCFPGRDCDVLRTRNDVIKNSGPAKIPYEMFKDHRWVELGEPGSGDWGLLSRSWIEVEGIAEGGDSAIYQLYGINALWPSGDGGSVHAVAVWMESDVFGIGDDMIEGAALYSLHQAFEAMEAYLDGAG